MRGILAALAVSTLLFAGSAAAEEVTARFVLNEMDCPDCTDFIFDLMTQQAGVQKVITNLDGNFFTVSFEDKVCNLGILVAALEMYGYYPDSVVIQPAV